ncbi:MAG: hypothetical protein C4B57_02015 [Deltaproteobacteria bacterium]|nr:MAG: hypothetical protein C4B57_02015 [Deltaproteobacteria bacterium]
MDPCASLHGRAACYDEQSVRLLRLAHVSAEHVASLSPRLNILRHGLDDDLVMLDVPMRNCGR